MNDINEKLRKLRLLKEEKFFIRKALNQSYNYNNKTKRDKLFRKSELVDIEIKKVEMEIKDAYNNNTSKSNNKKES